MNKNKLKLFLLLVTLTAALSGSEPEGANPKGHHWASYKQTYGVEHVSVKFPHSPKIAPQNQVVFIASQKKNASYVMITSMLPIGGIQTDEAFPVHLASSCLHPFDLVDYRVSLEEGKEILDTVSHNTQTAMVVKTRMIVTKRNFYILRTTAPAGEKEEHEYFIRSFDVSY